MRILFLLLVLAGARADAPPVQAIVLPAEAAGDRQAPRDPLPAFLAWLERLRKGREMLETRTSEDLRSSIGDLRSAWAVDPGRQEEIATALLDFLGLCSPAAALEGAESRAAEARSLALEALRVHLNPEFLRWLSREVLALPSQPLDRRLAALAVLAEAQDDTSLLPLLTCARETEPRLRFAALEALVGREDEGIHALFLDELERSLAESPAGSAEAGSTPAPARGDPASWLAELHFREAVLPPRSPLVARLTALVARGLASSDWREVSRAVALSRPLEAESVVPFLIEALSRWKNREEAGAQALRVEMEILRDLEARSGRKLGPSPADWSAWWRAHRRGDLKGGGPRTGERQETTRVSFFGLAPATDRVAFVIDRSGSMETKLGPDTGVRGRKRWEEAVEQLLGFVDSIGPRARFGVLVFHDYPEEWRPTLVQADLDGKKSARAWLAHHHPGGGTHLQGGISRALKLQPDGLPDLASLEADTVIVLCDGETAEGPGWVEPFLRQANSRARVVFHCVKIGPGGDGTLEKLAAGSGGDFVRIDG